MAGKKTCANCNAPFAVNQARLPPTVVARCSACGSASYREENVTPTEWEALLAADEARDADYVRRRNETRKPGEKLDIEDAWPSRQ